MTYLTRSPIVPALLLALNSVVVAQSRAADPLVYISAFAAGEQGAVHAYQLDEQTGRLTLQHRTADVEHPFFLALASSGKFLYSIHAKEFSGKENEHIAAYRIGKAGALTLLNRQSARGTAACYLDVDESGKTLVVANYTTGSVASLPIRDDGSLSEAAAFVQHDGSSVNESRQQGPHAHCFVIAPNNRFAYAADLGTDEIRCYRLDAKQGKISPNPKQPFVRTPPGAGPRHLTFDPTGEHVYVVNELANSVTLFDFDSESGFLAEQQTVSTLPADFDGVTHTADVKITPNGKFLYATNRGHDSIAGYRIGKNGRLERLAITASHGKGPQNLAITANGKLLICANMAGDNVAVFRIDEKGGIELTGEPIEIPKPSCVMLLGH
ncbi:MAG: lactonase family protein [Pirellulaceae bacterium]|jgi:6-phosphogluconolactonase|nr:lactonase family protein [Pirellulaceae bacterium]MDP7016119.1 lactonase family protein [Pirellulaceae bacterium]